LVRKFNIGTSAAMESADAVATGNQVNKSVIIITRLSRSSHRMNKERK